MFYNYHANWWVPWVMLIPCDKDWRAITVQMLIDMVETLIVSNLLYAML